MKRGVPGYGTEIDDDPLRYGRIVAPGGITPNLGMGGGSLTGGMGGDDDGTGPEKDRFAKENHCEIERRRRNKMTAYITELSDMVPTCSALARKPDKLTILRMAVAHMKQLRGTGNTAADGVYKPSFLTDQELKHLILEAADGFLFVVACDTGRVMYVSDSVTPVLNHPQAEMFGGCFYDYVHQEDIEKVREQISTQEPQHSGRILDLKTGTVKKEGHQASMRLCMGSRRQFICRMRIGNHPPDTITASHLHRLRQRNNGLGTSPDGHNYAIVHCTGYVKNWPPTDHAFPGIGMDPSQVEDTMAPSMCCLVAIGRLQVVSTSAGDDMVSANPHEFITRHSVDGSISFCDQRVLNVIGFAPQEILGKSIYEMAHPEDVGHIKENIDQIIKLKGQVITYMHRFRAKNRDWIWTRTSAYAFLNPYSDEIEYIVSTHSLPNKTEPGTGGMVADTSSTGVGGEGFQGHHPGIDYSLQQTRRDSGIYMDRPPSSYDASSGAAQNYPSPHSSRGSKVPSPPAASPQQWTPHIQQAGSTGAADTGGPTPYTYGPIPPPPPPHQSQAVYAQLSGVPQWQSWGGHPPIPSATVTSGTPPPPTSAEPADRSPRTPASNSSAVGPHQPPTPTSVAPPVPVGQTASGKRGHELSDMLSMLGQTGADGSSFEDLHMFQTNFEGGM
ncbi:unnamed protein product [Cyprideis torosa]|uniref:Aryl hydrocarbon receptor nuclear translocator homolog n=1 Tax=Cyprideis torosa TaxID=163714 RepID=A0A7R8ZL37_9CRUS|nr:unnamed protein product [Cyprideis torosa]CAG0881516.1 unnamed protein product [Cyprideis torosa]